MFASLLLAAVTSIDAVSFGRSVSAVPAAAAMAHRVTGLGLRDLGPASARGPIALTLTLKRRNTAELAQLIEAQTDRNSPLRGRYLTPQQFDAYFGPSPASRGAVAKIMRAAGFAYDDRPSPASIERFVGSVGAANRLFATDVHSFVQRNRAVRLATLVPARIPKTLASDVLAVSGFDTLDAPSSLAGVREANSPASAVAGRAPLPAPAAVSASPSPAPACQTVPRNATYVHTPLVASGNGNPGFGPGTFQADFDFPKERNCPRATTVGILSADVPQASDISSFYSTFDVVRSLPPYTERITGTGSFNSGFLGEATLDVDTISSLVPDVNVKVYVSDDTSFSSMTNSFNDVASDNDVDVLSVSIVNCEYGNASEIESENSAVTQLAAQGITVVAASGDTGYDVCFDPQNPGIGAPASSPYAVAVGGVSPVSISTDYRSVTGWSGSGGGESIVVAKPGYQAGLGAACAGSFRCIPDIALASGAGTYPMANTATGGIYIFINGTSEALSGTSLAAPIFAAMQAAIDESTQRRHGYINPLLYADYYLFNNPKFKSLTEFEAFADVTTGNNGRAAGRGWDYVTGLGVPDGQRLSNVEIF